MADKHSELEIKLDAEDVDIGPFHEWCIKQGHIRYKYAESPDVYWKHGKNVVRHRWSGGGGELTVKLRRHRKSCIDRQEIDLKFDPSIEQKDVVAWLEAAGFERELVLFKKCYIYWIKRDGHEFTVVLYDVEQFDKASGKNINHRRLLEVEVEKGDHATKEECMTLLNEWENELRRWFKLGKRQDLSLYEMYSGKRYKQQAKNAGRN